MERNETQGNYTRDGQYYTVLFILILKYHDNQSQREIFIIIISPMWYYCKHCDYDEVYCSNICFSKIFPSCLHNFSAYSTVKWYRDNID